MKSGRASRSTGRSSTFLFWFHNFITSSRFPSGDFRFHPPALSPDMRVICVTPTALNVKDKLRGDGE
jgi:hypothetical protein